MINNNVYQEATTLINEKPLMGVFLMSSAACGMTTIELATAEAAKSNMEVTYNVARSTLSRMTNLARYGLQPFFKVISVGVEGRAGKKPQSYLLTKFGKQVIEKKYPGLPIHFLDQPDRVKLKHRFCQMDVYARAQKQGWQAKIEDVIPYGVTRSIRPDVTLITPEVTLYVEIEQALKKDTKGRADVKIRNWNDYYNETGEIPKILFLFNLQEVTAENTLSYWRDALARSNTQLEFSYKLMSSLGSGKAEEILHENMRLVPEFKPLPVDEDDKWILPEGINNLAVDMDINLIAQIEVKEKLLQLKASRTPPMGMEYASLIRLLESTKFIWDIDFTFENSGLDNNQKESVRKALDIPDNSISMLRYYLNHPLNQDLCARLKNLHAVARRQANAITLYRMTLNTIVLEFLEYFRIAEVDGLFNAPVVMPDHSAKTSRPSVQVLIAGDIANYVPSGTAVQIQEYTTALSWVLQCLILYPDKLGLT